MTMKEKVTLHSLYFTDILSYMQPTDDDAKIRCKPVYGIKNKPSITEQNKVPITLKVQHKEEYMYSKNPCILN
jgi:hypothetical protein